MSKTPERSLLALKAKLSALLGALLLAACAQAPQQPAAAAAPEAVLAPNANLLVQGIPPIPQSLVRQVERYTDFRGHSFVDWHPLRREMLVSHRKAGSSTAQLFRVDAPWPSPCP